MRSFTGLVVLLLAVSMQAEAAQPCKDCDDMNAPHEPFRIYGNTYYVGTHGLSSILITSAYGHVLIDGGLPESAPLIAANIEKLGFKLTDVKAILMSHAHHDHVGGIAELQKASGASVYARRPAEAVLRTGKLQRDDPQYDARSSAIPRLDRVWILQDDQLLGVGSVRLRVIATPGHTPGGTSLSWDACENDQCLRMVYADSLMPVSTGSFLFTRNPQVLEDFEQSFKRLEALPCDVLLTPHPGASGLFERLERPDGKPESIKDADGCKAYVQAARTRLAERVASEQSAGSRRD